MTYYFSYIADAEDPKFQWNEPSDAAYRVGNLPRRVIPAEPHFSLAIGVVGMAKLIESGRYDGKQMDWGAWAIKLTGAQLVAFFEEHPAFLGLDTSMESITKLHAERSYIIVAAEGV
ncbi:MAG: hypothetical protein ACK5RK_10670 [Betaproteobacteria bacterium]